METAKEPKSSSSKRKYFITNPKNVVVEIYIKGKGMYFNPNSKVEVSKEIYNSIKSNKLIKSEV